MTWFIYNLLLFILAPLWVPWMIWRAKKRKEPVNWQERTGLIRELAKKGKNPRIWFHTVSVGEAVASEPILRELKDLQPELEIILSVTTSSGFQTATAKLSEYVSRVIYFPIDIPKFVLRSLATVRPDVIVIMETELWLNFTSIAESMGIPVMVVNGRLSDRSFKNSKNIKYYYKAILSKITKILVQTKQDQERFEALGGQNVEILGNCKYDEAAKGTETDVEHWQKQFGVADADSVLVIGSTRGELEEDFVLEALSKSRDQFDRVIWAPRHLERVEGLSEKVNKQFGTVSLRSKNEQGWLTILDTYGELGHVYALADIVIIGGGFDELGGQNLLQPLAHGKPVIHGPNMHNFRDVAEQAHKVEATLICSTPEELGDALNDLNRNQNPKKLNEMGESAKKMIEASLGASKKYAEAILEELNSVLEA